jgi:hypothetical protein
LGHVTPSYAWEIVLVLLFADEHDFHVCIVARASGLPISAKKLFQKPG